MISVTSFGLDFLPGGYTNYGPGCKIAAPGGEMTSDNDKIRAVLSTGVANAAQGSPGAIMDDGRSDSQYVYMQGTSMACPQQPSSMPPTTGPASHSAHTELQ